MLRSTHKLAWVLLLWGCERAAAPVCVPAPVTPEVVSTSPPADSEDTPRAEPSTPVLGLLHQPLRAQFSQQAAQSAVYSVGDWPQVVTPLHPGAPDDRQLVEVHCMGCHSTSYVSMQPPRTRTEWQATVQKMRSVHGAVIPDAAAARIAVYLEAYYGPASVPSRRTPRAATVAPQKAGGLPSPGRDGP